jgi:hypothetical protein
LPLSDDAGLDDRHVPDGALVAYRFDEDWVVGGGLGEGDRRVALDDLLLGAERHVVARVDGVREGVEPAPVAHDRAVGVDRVELDVAVGAQRVHRRRNGALHERDDGVELGGSGFAELRELVARSFLEARRDRGELRQVEAFRGDALHPSITSSLRCAGRPR